MQMLLKTGIGAIIAIISYLIGGFDVSFKALLIIMILDYLTGIMSAYKEKKLSSKIGFKGILKKCLYIVLVIVGVTVDNLLGHPNVTRIAVIYYLIANDGLSIIENLTELGVPIPIKLKESLQQLKE